MSHKRENAQAEEKKLKALEKQRGVDAANVGVKSKELEKLRAELDKLKEQSEKDKEAQAAAQRHLQASVYLGLMCLSRFCTAGLAKANPKVNERLLAVTIILFLIEISPDLWKSSKKYNILTILRYLLVIR